MVYKCLTVLPEVEHAVLILPFLYPSWHCLFIHCFLYNAVPFTALKWSTVKNLCLVFFLACCETKLHDFLRRYWNPWTTSLSCVWRLFNNSLRGSWTNGHDQLHCCTFSCSCPLHANRTRTWPTSFPHLRELYQDVNTWSDIDWNCFAYHLSRWEQLGT